MAAIKREWNRSHPTVTAGGTADAQTLTYTTAPPAYVAGMQFTFISAGANTIAAPTLNVNALGAKTIVRADGSTDLVAGEIVSGAVTTVYYDGTNMRLIGTQATDTGIALMHAADSAAVRTAAEAPNIPVSATAIGQFTTLSASSGAACALPASGTWAYLALPITNSDRTWGTNAVSVAAGVAAGGTTVGAATTGIVWTGFCWRIS